MIVKILLGLSLLLITIYFGWLFWWPIIECTYARSWDPILISEYKRNLFIIAGFIHIPSLLISFKLGLKVIL